MPKRGRLGHFFDLVPALLGWAALMLVLWGFVFLRLDDAKPENKLVIYAACDVTDARELMIKLEDLSGTGTDDSLFGSAPIRKIKLYTTSFFSALSDPLKDGDIFIVSEEMLSDLGEAFAALPPGENDDKDKTEVKGILFFDAAKGERRLEKYFLFDESKRYYLCFSAKSLHAGDRDTAAFTLADLLLNLD